MGNAIPMTTRSFPYNADNVDVKASLKIKLNKSKIKKKNKQTYWVHLRSHSFPINLKLFQPRRSFQKISMKHMVTRLINIWSHYVSSNSHSGIQKNINSRINKKIFFIQNKTFKYPHPDLSEDSSRRQGSV